MAAKRRATKREIKGRKPLAIDLFAGAGGLSIGLEIGSFRCVFANELSPVYAETLKHSHPSASVVTEDIRKISAAEVRRSLSLAVGELDLVAGGPPCQGFSINAPVRSTSDRRNHLFLEFLRFVEEFRPKCVLIENVPGIVSFDRGNTVRAIQSRLQALGYVSDIKILFTANFGVPQMRWRTTILATRLAFPAMMLFPEATHKARGRPNFTTTLNGISVVPEFDLINSSATKPFTTVGDAILDLPEIENGGGEAELRYSVPPKSEFQRMMREGAIALTNHQCAGLGPANLKRLPHIPRGGSWRDIPFDLLPEGMKRARRSDHTRRYGRLDPSGLGSTILTKCDPHWGTYIHPFQDRVLSVREAARIQSFPDRIQFFGLLSEQYEQVGNAVPPLFGLALGERIAFCIRAFEAGIAINPTSVGSGSQMRLGLGSFVEPSQQ